MRAALYGFLAVSVVGCGYSEDKFITKYTDAECTYALECYTDPVLNVLGYTDHETCVSKLGPDLTGEWEGCFFEAPAARECIKQMEDRTCAAEGEEDTPPSVCEGVFTCSDTDTGDDTDSGEDTDS